MMVLARSLPEQLQASLFVVQHISASTPSALPQILSRVGALPALHPLDSAMIELGRIYVAPPDHHLLLEEERVRVSKGSRDHHFSPFIPLILARLQGAVPASVPSGDAWPERDGS